MEKKFQLFAILFQPSFLFILPLFFCRLSKQKEPFAFLAGKNIFIRVIPSDIKNHFNSLQHTLIFPVQMMKMIEKLDSQKKSLTVKKIKETQENTGKIQENKREKQLTSKT